MGVFFTIVSWFMGYTIATGSTVTSIIALEISMLFISTCLGYAGFILSWKEWFITINKATLTLTSIKRYVLLHIVVKREILFADMHSWQATITEKRHTAKIMITVKKHHPMHFQLDSKNLEPMENYLKSVYSVVPFDVRVIKNKGEHFE